MRVSSTSIHKPLVSCHSVATRRTVPPARRGTASRSRSSLLKRADTRARQLSRILTSSYARNRNYTYGAAQPCAVRGTQLVAQRRNTNGGQRGGQLACDSGGGPGRGRRGVGGLLVFHGTRTGMAAAARAGD